MERKHLSFILVFGFVTRRFLHTSQTKKTMTKFEFSQNGTENIVVFCFRFVKFVKLF